MEIFSLKRDAQKTDRGEFAAFVVVAESEHGARRLAALAAGNEGAFPWAFEAECARVGTAAPDVPLGILMGQYVPDYD